MLEYYPNSRWEDDALLLLAKAFYRSGKYRNAIGKVDELQKKYPESEFMQEGFLWKGMSLLKVAQPDSARQILTRLFNPDSPINLRAEAHFALGEYYYDDQRWDPAIDQFRIILELEIEDEWVRGDALLKVGDCLKRLERFQDAVELYDDVLATKPPRRLRFEAMFQRAVVLRKLGKHEESLVEFEDLLRDAAFMDDFPRIELEAARSEAALGHAEDARERLEKII